MRVTALLLPLLLPAASEAGPLRRPAKELNRADSLRKWPRDFLSNSSATTTTTSVSTEAAEHATPLSSSTPLAATFSSSTTESKLSSTTQGGQAVTVLSVGLGTLFPPSSTSTSQQATSTSPGPVGQTFITFGQGSQVSTTSASSTYSSPAVTPHTTSSLPSLSPFLSSGALVTPSDASPTSVNTGGPALPKTSSSPVQQPTSSSPPSVPEESNPPAALSTPAAAPTISTPPAASVPPAVTTSPAVSASPTPSTTHIQATGVPNSSVPTAITSAPPSTGTVSQDVYQSNLQAALKYNAIFAGLTEQSACTPNQAACVGGNVAKCGSNGVFDTIASCTSGAMCYALPMNSTIGVSLGCVDTAIAKSILGSLLPYPPSSSPNATGAPGSPTAGPKTATVTVTVSEFTVTVKVTETAQPSSQHTPPPASADPSGTPSSSGIFITKTIPLAVVPATPAADSHIAV